MTDPRRGDRPGRGDTSTDDVTPWPGWIRYTLLAVLVAVVGIGLVVALYDKGFLPIAGPFVVLFLLPLLIPLRQRGLRNRSRRLARQADERLGALGRAIELEQARSPQDRASAATDESLASAGAHVDAARQQLGTGQEGAAADTVESLSRAVTGRWQSQAALTKQVTRAASTSRRLQQVLRQAGR